MSDANTAGISFITNSDTLKTCELFIMDAYMCDLSEGKVIAEIDINAGVAKTGEVLSNDEENPGLTFTKEDLNNKFVLACRTDEGLEQVSNYTWIVAAEFAIE